MEIKYDEEEWGIIARTENFIEFRSTRKIRYLPKRIVFTLCEELLKHGYTPDFSQLQYYEMIFRKSN